MRFFRLQTKAAPTTEPNAAFDQTFREYARGVFELGRRILGRADEADDLVQDVFLKVYSSMHQLREPEKLRNWLMKIAVNRTKRQLLKRRLLRRLGLDVSHDYSDIADQGRVSPEDAAFLAQVYRILDRIPVNDQVAWCLHHVDGETLKDAATLCGCSLAQVKRRILAAQARIQQEIGHA